ncbi:MAG: DUF2807 domain-containing protein [Flavobacterium sp.]
MKKTLLLLTFIIGFNATPRCNAQPRNGIVVSIIVGLASGVIIFGATYAFIKAGLYIQSFFVKDKNFNSSDTITLYGGIGNEKTYGQIAAAYQQNNQDNQNNQVGQNNQIKNSNQTTASYQITNSNNIDYSNITGQTITENSNNKELSEKQYKFQNIQGLQAFGFGTLNILLATDDENCVIIQADKDTLPSLQAVITDTSLTIGHKKDASINTKNPIIYNVMLTPLTIKNLKFIWTKGSIEASLNDLTITSPSLMLKTENSASITGGTLKNDNNNTFLTIESCGSSKIDGITGTVSELNITGTHSSKIFLNKLISDSTTINTSCSSSAKIYTEKCLTANVYGSSTLDCYGKARLSNGIIDDSAKITYVQ